MVAIAANLQSAAWSRGLRPPPALTVSEWADQYRVVTAPSPHPGPWRNARTPYLIGIMDCLSPSHPAREIDVMKGTQMGVTEAAVNGVGYYSHQAPASGMIVLPSKDTAGEWSRIRLTGLFENTPVLHNLLSDQKDRRSTSNTLYSKRLVGGTGTWKIAWSSSGKILRSTPAAIIIADEVDGFVRAVPGEGEPIALLRKRFANFRRGKFLRISSPTDRTGSRIEAGFLEGDQRYFFLPCPSCGFFQRLQFNPQLTWEKGKPETAAYNCVSCKGSIGEFHKTEMLAGGMWVATKAHPELIASGFAEPASISSILEQMELEVHPSFHLSSLYSPLGWYSWRLAAYEWDKAQSNPELLKVFVTTVLGETWIDRGEAPDWEKIYARRQNYSEGTVPRGALFLVAGVDVQADRLEVEVVGYGRGKESWSISYMQLLGDTSTEIPWRLLEEVLARDWPTWDSKTMPIMVMAIDSGYRPQNVYDFAKRHAQPAHSQAGSRITAVRTIVPTKGGPDPYRINAGVTSSDAARRRKGIKIVTIGTAAVKQELYDFLRLPQPGVGETYPPGYCHFPIAYEAGYFQGLCSESRVTRTSGKAEWVKDPSVRNEPLDIRGCARLAAALYGIDRFTDRQWIELGWKPELIATAGPEGTPPAGPDPGNPPNSPAPQFRPPSRGRRVFARFRT